jgi:plastocyanin
LKRRLFIGTLVLLMLLSGCTAPPEATTPGDTAGLPVKTAPPPEETGVSLPMTATVENVDFGFFPPELVIARGGTVTWRQKDYEKHTVTGSEFTSPELNKGQVFSHTFSESGVYEYRCKLHASMKGKIIVK